MDKPAGPTSHDVVRRVRQAVGTRAVGHTGTLDPFATGLLVVLTGRATRLARFVEGDAKTYRATVRLGVATSTDDLEGEPVRVVDGPWPAPDAVAAAVAAFAGAQRQRPPAFSAKHVGGERSHVLARRGTAVALPEVDVTVHAIELLGYAPPLVDLRATVSAGTYLRAIGRDLGERLGVGGHLTALRRERIGALDVADALPWEALVPGVPLLAPERVLPGLPRVTLEASEAVGVRHGRDVRAPDDAEGRVLLMEGDRLLAVAERQGGALHPVVVLEAA